MNEFLMIAGMLIVTFSLRYMMIPISGKFSLPKLMERSLAYVPPAVLTAIIVPAVFMPTGEGIRFSLDNPYLIGAIGASIVGWFTKNLLLTIIVSMAIFLGWQWILTQGLL